jgi:hypothetical protein
LHHDARFKLAMSETQVNDIARLAARIDWSRYNPDWIPMLGQPEVDKVTGSEVVNAAGQPRVSITGSGRYNVQMILNYLRAKTGISEALAAAGADKEDGAEQEVAVDLTLQGAEQ